MLEGILWRAYVCKKPQFHEAVTTNWIQAAHVVHRGGQNEERIMELGEERLINHQTRRSRTKTFGQLDPYGY